MSSSRSADALAAEAVAEIARLPLANTPAVRRVRHRLTARLKEENPRYVLSVARGLIARTWRWVGYEVIRHHPEALASLRLKEVTALGAGIDSWVAVDTFGIYIAGPAWRQNQISDDDVIRWTNSKDRWWRRAALVATVPLNLRAQGGFGDARRTVKVMSQLLDDRDPMVVKAMSWALRALAVVDPEAAQAFMDRQVRRLAPLVLRETRHKLATGTKQKRRPKLLD